MNSHVYSKLIVDNGAKTIQWGKIIFLTNGAETTEYLYTKKIILDPYHKPYTKIDSKQITDLNIDLNEYILTTKFKDGSS